MKLQSAILVCVSVGLFFSTLVGCSKTDDGLSTEQRQTQDRFTQIMDRSGGKWENLTDEEKKFMVGLANGNEQAAKTMFTMRALREQRPPNGGPNPTVR